jgi:hypothetical protein
MRLLVGAEHDRFMRALEAERERQRHSLPMLRYRMQRVEGTGVAHVVCEYPRFKVTKLVSIGAQPSAYPDALRWLVNRCDREFEESNRPHPRLPW